MAYCLNRILPLFSPLVFFLNPSLLTSIPPPSALSLPSSHSIVPPHHHSVTYSLIPHSIHTLTPSHSTFSHLLPSFPPSLLPSFPPSLMSSCPRALLPSLSCSLALSPSVPLYLCTSLPLSLCPSVPLYLSNPSVPVVTLQGRAAATHGRRLPLTAWLSMPLSKAAPPTLSCVPWSYYTSTSGCGS